MNKKILCAVLFCLTAPLWGAQTESLSCAVERAAFQAKQEKISLKQEAHARFATAADFYSQTSVGEYVDSLVSEQVFKSVGPENSDLVWQVVSVHVPQEAYEACWTALDKMGKLNFSANRRAVNGKIKESHNLDTHTFRWKEIVYRLEGTGSHLFSIKAPLDGNVLHGAHSADKWAKSFQITFESVETDFIRFACRYHGTVICQLHDFTGFTARRSAHIDNPCSLRYIYR